MFEECQPIWHLAAWKQLAISLNLELSQGTELLAFDSGEEMTDVDVSKTERTNRRPVPKGAS